MTRDRSPCTRRLQNIRGNGFFNIYKSWRVAFTICEHFFNIYRNFTSISLYLKFLKIRSKHGQTYVRATEMKNVKNFDSSCILSKAMIETGIISKKY